MVRCAGYPRLSFLVQWSECFDAGGEVGGFCVGDGLGGVGYGGEVDYGEVFQGHFDPLCARP